MSWNGVETPEDESRRINSYLSADPETQAALRRQYEAETLSRLARVSLVEEPDQKPSSTTPHNPGSPGTLE